ncbi:coiled-coil domain-containing protein 86 [Aricia agestis]|uniref:coiled-coil domain-containing protein 86 n=1 Tax=Aricia agestis TaxID=91739 RepID=UPI001C20AD8B|nr:coiled-coil domain-containing protein 86 [Aricia agestis]
MAETSNSNQQVLSILQKIKNQNNESKVLATESTSKDKKIKTNSIRGMPKSGKFWKTKKDRFSSIVKTKGIRPDFKKKTELRQELNRTKALSKQLVEQINEKHLTQKERRRVNIKRAEENKKKSEIVQVITNSTKLKRMKKKQLRFIEKRDVNKESK